MHNASKKLSGSFFILRVRSAFNRNTGEVTRCAGYLASTAPLAHTSHAHPSRTRHDAACDHILFPPLPYGRGMLRHAESMLSGVYCNKPRLNESARLNESSRLAQIIPAQKIHRDASSCVPMYYSQTAIRTDVSVIHDHARSSLRL